MSPQLARYPCRALTCIMEEGRERKKRTEARRRKGGGEEKERRRGEKGGERKGRAKERKVLELQIYRQG